MRWSVWSAQVAQEITTAGTHTIKWVYSKDSSGFEGSDCVWVDYVHFGSGAPVVALADGLDTTLPVTTGGDGDWSGSTWPTPYYDGDSTRSADVDDYEESIMETAGYGPGTVSFYCRVSLEANRATGQHTH